MEKFKRTIYMQKKLCRDNGKLGRQRKGRTSFSDVTRPVEQSYIVLEALNTD